MAHEVTSAMEERARVTDNDGNHVAVVLEEILAYLHAHPSAADTVDGIAQWWLVAAAKHAAIEDVQDALDRLVVKGIVDVCRLPDGGQIYGLAASARGPGTHTDVS